MIGIHIHPAAHRTGLVRALLAATRSAARAAGRAAIDATIGAAVPAALACREAMGCRIGEAAGKRLDL